MAPPSSAPGCCGGWRALTDFPINPDLAAAPLDHLPDSGIKSATRLARIVAAANSANPALLVFYNGDGNIEPAILEPSEIGVDILDPAQRECVGPARLRWKYGNHRGPLRCCARVFGKGQQACRVASRKDVITFLVSQIEGLRGGGTYGMVSKQGSLFEELCGNCKYSILL